ncbi:MAG: hypothetical protein KDD70_19095, partial [Bdellovibrionales bacterium]|nr:hypothetical protein [Bdellovibrionales bacterium]
VDHLTQKILISERHVFLKAKWIKFEYSNKGEIRLSVNLMPGTICKLSFEPSPRRCHLMLSWQRSGDADAEPPYIFHPVEVPQSVSYNFASRTWKNLETGAIIHGRQQAQSFSSWGGWMYLPREESDSDQWCLPEGHVS